MNRFLSTILICLAGFEWSMAIPAFARKYEQTCTMCHVSIPKLNAFGAAFRNNGYRLPKERRGDRAQQPVKLGGKAQKKLWPKRSIWPGQIPGSVPLAVRLELDANYTPDQEVTTEFNAHEIELISAGNLGKMISFMVEGTLFEDGESGELERAFIQLNGPVKQHPLFNIKMGQFEPRFVPFSRIRRITMSDYITSSITNGDNAFQFKEQQVGLEIWGTRDSAKGGGLAYGIGIINGQGPDREANSDKDMYGRLSYKLGGMSLRGDKGPIADRNWQDDSVSIGFSTYRGRGLVSDFDRHGFDVSWYTGDVHVFGAILFGSDDFASASFDFTAWFLETNVVFMPWLLGALRWEESDTPDDLLVPDQRRLLANLSASIRPNVVTRIELIKELEGNKEFTGRLRFDFAF